MLFKILGHLLIRRSKVENHRHSISRLIGVLAIAVIIMACSVSMPGNSTEDANSLSIVISNPLGDITVSAGEEVAITSTAFSEAGVDHVELLVSGQVAAISTSLDPSSQTYVAVTSWIPDAPGSYNISAAVEDTDGQRAVSDFLTVTVEEQAEEQSLALTATSPPPAPTNAPAPTNTQLPTVTIEPSPTSSGAFTPLPIIVNPIPIILTPNPTSGFIFSPIPITILPSGSPAVHFEIADFQIPPHEKWTAEAKCPEGSMITGGGFYSLTNMNNVENSAAQVNGWMVTATNYSNSNQAMRAVAICLSNSGGTITKKGSTVDVPPKSDQVISVMCPAESVVTGGGWVVNEEIFVSESEQSGNGWVLRVTNSSDHQSEVFVQVLCLSGTNASSFNFIESVEIGEQSFNQVFVYCGPGQLVTGGGFNRELQSNFSSPLGPNSTGPKYGWSAGAYSPYVNISKGIHASVTCLSFP
jgi:hypothetical protein